MAHQHHSLERTCLRHRRSFQTKEIKSNRLFPSALQNPNPSHITAGACKRFAFALHPLRPTKHLTHTGHLPLLQPIWVSSRAASCACSKHCYISSASAAPALLSVRPDPSRPVIYTANVPPRHLLLLPRSTRRPQPGHSHLAKGC